MRARRHAIHVSLELGQGLADLAAYEELLADSIAADLGALCVRLGIPGWVHVRIQKTESLRPLRISINGRLASFPPRLLARAWLATAPRELHRAVLRGAEGGQLPFSWIDKSTVRDAGLPVVAAWLDQAVVQVALERPSLLLGARQLELCSPSFHDSCRPALPVVLPALLDLGVSIEDRPFLSEILLQGSERGRSPEDSVEAAFAELRSHEVRILVAPETLLEGRLAGMRLEPEPISVYDDKIPAAQQLFAKMEKEFLRQFGVRLPDIVWVPSPELALGTVAVEIGLWRGLPIPLPPAGRRLVDAPPGDTRLADCNPEPAVQPIYGTPQALVLDRYKRRLEEERRPPLITYGVVDFVILNLYGELAARPLRLLGIEDVEFEIATLEKAGYADVAAAALARYTLGELTRVFRAMLAEGLSLRDLHGLLERLVAFAVVPRSTDGLYVLDERLPVSPDASPEALRDWSTYYAYLRRRLPRAISYTHAWAEDGIGAYELDPALEKRIASRDDTLSDREAELVRDELWRHVVEHAPVPVGQVVVTSDSARPAVRALLADELPDLPVLARSELALDAQRTVLATIGGTERAGSP